MCKQQKEISNRSLTQYRLTSSPPAPNDILCGDKLLSKIHNSLSSSSLSSCVYSPHSCQTLAIHHFNLKIFYPTERIKEYIDGPDVVSETRHSRRSLVSQEAQWKSTQEEFADVTTNVFAVSQKHSGYSRLTLMVKYRTSHDTERM
jgi:hypothetical protein